MRVVLVSTYELGRQPFGLASPAAWLRQAGASVTCVDLSRDRLREEDCRDAALVAFYVPMHTATRLAARAAEQSRRINPAAHLCFYGLYAPVNADYLRSIGGQTVIGGEFEQPLVELYEQLRRDQTARDENVGRGFSRAAEENPKAAALSGSASDCAAGVPLAGPGFAPVPPAEIAEPADGTPAAQTAASPARPSETIVSLARQRFIVPDRAGLPPLDRYAHLHVNGETRVVGYTEATRGCKHLCRHCPIVPVYNGAFRVVQRDIVLEDMRRQVAAGAQHITFGDPDFFNGPTHSMHIVDAFHREFPAATYDVTIRIEHLLKHRDLLPVLRDTGCLFVVSAVESGDGLILERLDKGHTRADFHETAELFRRAALTLTPTFVPFTPWTTAAGYCELLRAIAGLDLVDHVAPIQLAIRLLIPAGSRLLELEEIRALTRETFDGDALSYAWRHPDAAVDQLAADVQRAAWLGAKNKQSRRETFACVWQLAHRAAGSGRPLPASAAAGAPAFRRTGVPFLNEPWYC